MARANSPSVAGGACPLRAAPGGDLLRHVAGLQEGVGIDRGAERPRFGRQAGQVLVAVFPALQHPGFAAFLEQPQPGDIFQEADLAGDADLVGVVGGERLRVDHRPVEFQSHQGPGARTDVAPVVAALGGNGDHGGGRVVAGGGVDRRVRRLQHRCQAACPAARVRRGCGPADRAAGAVRQPTSSTRD